MSHPSTFEDINTEVTGFSYYTAEHPEPRLDALEAPEDGKIHILLGHGGDANHVPIDRAALLPPDFRISHWGTSTGQRSYWTKSGILRFPGAA